MFCSKCGAETTSGSNFCVKCGAPIISAVQNTTTANMPPTPSNVAIAQLERKPKTGKKKALIIAVAAGCIALIAVFLLFIMPRFNSGSTPSAEGTGRTPSAEEIDRPTSLEAAENTGSSPSSEETGNMPSAEETGSTHSVEGNGFPTSHEAAEAYLDAFFNVDIDKLISTCAVETFVENFDSLSQIQELGQFYFVAPAVLYEAMGAFDEGLAAQSRVGEITSKLLSSYRWLCLSDSLYKDYSSLLDMSVTALQGPDYYTEALEYFSMLERDFNAEKVRAVKEYMLMTPYEYAGDAYDSYRSDRVIRQLDSLVSIYGADDIEEFIAIFTLDGEEWAIAFETLCYNGKWYAEPDSFSGGTLGIPVAHTSVERISELTVPPERAPGVGYTGVRSGSAPSPGIRIEGAGEDTAKGAVSVYMDGFLGADIYRILQACAVETYVENYNSVYAMERLGAITLTSGFDQTYYNFSPRMAATNRAGMIVSMVRMRYLSLCTESIHDFYSYSIQMSNEDEISSFYRDFMLDFDNHKLRSVESFEILTANDFSRDIREMYNSEMNMRNIQKRIYYLGADDYESFVVTFRMPDGVEWALGLSAYKYGNKWYAENDSILAVLLGMPAIGITPFDYSDY